MNKIGIGIITCNRHNYLTKLLTSLTSSLKDVKDVVIVNDGEPTTTHIPEKTEWINNTENLGVGKSKNKALEFLLNKNCNYIFLLEDDIVIKDTNVFNKYIEASQVSGIQHFNFAFHGLDNYDSYGRPAVRLKVEYSKDIAVCFYPNLYGAFSFYTEKCLKETGLMDEFYYNAVEHVDHTNQVILKGMHPPFRWFADIAGSENYIQEIDRGHSGSEIRRDERWIQNFHKSADHFAKKFNFDIRNPYAKTADRNETLKIIKEIKNTYGNK
jgi:GT2 family glycosyltransferase